MATLALSNLSLRHGPRTLVENLSAEIAPGRFVAIMGPSGSGKTTLLHALAGMHPPAAGAVTYGQGRTPPSSPPLAFRPRIGIIFQNFRLCLGESALHNVLLGRLGARRWWHSLCGFPRTDHDEAYALLCRLRLGDCARRPTAQLSGGERQRTALARALFQSPECYLADEPISQLDAPLAELSLQLLHQQTREQGKTVFCVLHDACLVDRFADELLLLNPQQPDRWTHRRIHP